LSYDGYILSTSFLLCRHHLRFVIFFFPLPPPPTPPLCSYTTLFRSSIVKPHFSDRVDLLLKSIAAVLPPGPGSRKADWEAQSARSEEHTSELQSPYDLVCRLLLEKKNKIQ